MCCRRRPEIDAVSIGKWLRGRLPSGADDGWIPLPDDLEARVPGNRERFALLTFDPDDPIGSRLSVLGDERTVAVSHWTRRQPNGRFVSIGAST